MQQQFNIIKSSHHPPNNMQTIVISSNFLILKSHSLCPIEAEYLNWYNCFKILTLCWANENQSFCSKFCLPIDSREFSNKHQILIDCIFEHAQIQARLNLD